MNCWFRNILLLGAGSALTVIAELGVPQFGLAIYGRSFQTAYTDCQLATLNAGRLNKLPLDDALAERIRKTEQIDEMRCFDERLVRNRLRRFRVSANQIESLELQGDENTGSSFGQGPASHYLIAPGEIELDRKLQKAVGLYGLRPLEIRRYDPDPKWKLGQALFFDRVLSGNRDVSCATCHLLQYGLSDGLPRSLGTNANGLGPDRELFKGKQAHPRHSLDLWNRDNNAASAFFWDGHVEVLHTRTGKRTFRSPLGEDLPAGFQNGMAVQAVFPIAVPDEMLGYFGDRSSSTLPTEHANKLNELVDRPKFANSREMIKSVHNHLLQRLLSMDGPASPWQREYRVMFHEAYPQKQIGELSIADLGNAIAHFEELAFASAGSAWDQYLAGNPKAITKQVKIGAIVFFGKGRCAACHSGPLFSDFQYHGIGIFSKIFVNGKYVDDLGRGAVTRNSNDNYHFRTPPLRNVAKFGPYFHDGSTKSLRAALVRHLEPLAKSGSYNPDGSFAIEKDQAASVSPIFASGVRLSDDEIGCILTFLNALEAQSRTQDQIIPSKVPSGIPIVQ